ncbi:MAG: NAD(P)H-dependent oxidoreductase subunit E [Candidatus Zixiibacteriota bacterium]
MTLKIHPDYDINEVISSIVQKYGAKPSALIMILLDVQKNYNYLPKDALEAVAKKMRLPLAQIYGVATFYRTFSLEPKRKHHICVCTGTACHVRQATVIVDKFERELGIPSGSTTGDLEFSLERVNCLGACALGPLVTVNDDYHGHMNVTKVDKLLTELRHKAKGRKTETSAVEEVA